ncbi:DUF1330 domain-containing protein [uncultured Tateyamaria sp.]|uniref:DUF1330 domain-containing protein n=1 Tax=uncultured Tateyamaria sp. TaxID=455651 RepID=UPI002626EC8D|nr:DUF1330 domain-containing protein [uncultured Tateyamaria sp.]
MSTQIPVLLVASLRVEEMASFQAGYVAPLKAINDRHGVETIVATPQLDALEGELTANVMAVLRFPSQAALDAWYADPDYLPLIEARQAATDQSASTLVALTPMA